MNTVKIVPNGIGVSGEFNQITDTKLIKNVVLFTNEEITDGHLFVPLQTYPQFHTACFHDDSALMKRRARNLQKYDEFNSEVYKTFKISMNPKPLQSAHLLQCRTSNDHLYCERNYELQTVLFTISIVSSGGVYELQCHW